MSTSTPAVVPSQAPFKRALLEWYQKHARPLPWRASHDPYKIWVSEIMLQQTTVTAVIPYFERFLNAFPDVTVLASADEQEVLRLWEGLGYYSRARNLRKAAQTIVSEFEGEFPRDVEALQSLPGIGRYTAGAIASFAFDIQAPIVEANTQRLYARLASFEGDLKTSVGQKFLWEFAGKLVPETDAGLFNQAVMELGSRICKPVEPDCPTCPVAKHCLAFRDGKQDVIPLPAPRPKITELTQAYIVVRHRDSILMRQYGAGERWAGLWDFVRVELDDETHQRLSGIKLGKKSASLFPLEPLKENDISTIEASLHSLTGLECHLNRALAILKQSVTRYRITLICLEADVGKSRLEMRSPFIWKRRDEVSELPLSVMGRKLMNLWQDR